MDVDAPAVEVWPEHMPAVQVFLRCGTQWRTSMAGYVGLDYNVAFRLLDRVAGSPDEWDDMLDCIRVMESEALRVIREASNNG